MPLIATILVEQFKATQQQYAPSLYTQKSEVGVCIRRSKNPKSQEFPLSHTVGNAILCYLEKVRPCNCQYRELFITLLPPHTPLSGSAIYAMVKKRLKSLNIILEHYGPHALRHACATHLINEGISLKEISDYLGHQSLESTRIYAKVDLVNLRKVAEIDLADLL